MQDRLPPQHVHWQVEGPSACSLEEGLGATEEKDLALSESHCQSELQGDAGKVPDLTEGSFL